jgi:hypothetical protein
MIAKAEPNGNDPGDRRSLAEGIPKPDRTELIGLAAEAIQAPSSRPSAELAARYADRLIAAVTVK